VGGVARVLGCWCCEGSGSGSLSCWGWESEAGGGKEGAGKEREEGRRSRVCTRCCCRHEKKSQKAERPM